MANNFKSCETCSYYVIDEDISNLSNEQQIEFENFDLNNLDNIDEEAAKRLARLVLDLRKQTCIGGLIINNQIKKNCRHHKILSPGFDKGQLLQSFIANNNKMLTKNGMIISILLTLFTISVTLYGVSQNTKNKALKSSIVIYQARIKSDSTQILDLKNSIINLQNLLKNQNHEQK